MENKPQTNKYQQLEREANEIDHIIIRNDDQGYSQDYANARTQLLAARALVDIAQSLDYLCKEYRVPGI